MSIELRRGHDGKFSARVAPGEQLHAPLTIHLDGASLARIEQDANSDLHLFFMQAHNAMESDRLTTALAAALDAWLLCSPPFRKIVLEREGAEHLTEHLLHRGLAIREADGSMQLPLELLWQDPSFWLCTPRRNSFALKYTMSAQGRRHPLRPSKPSGTVYSRYIPWLDKEMLWEVADVERHLEPFHRWMNNPRVARFWQEDGDTAKHRRYLTDILADPHVIPLIGSLGGQPFVYVEMYWAKEDRIAPFYDASDYDRGWHVLVGEEAFLGKASFTAWFPCLAHYIFLDDARTQRIVCEPRADNARLIGNLDKNGYARLKHFDFPHKRALLAMLTRERFFTDRLWIPQRDAKQNA